MSPTPFRSSKPTGRWRYKRGNALLSRRLLKIETCPAVMVEVEVAVTCSTVFHTQTESRWRLATFDEIQGLAPEARVLT